MKTKKPVKLKNDVAWIIRIPSGMMYPNIYWKKRDAVKDCHPNNQIIKYLLIPIL